MKSAVQMTAWAFVTLVVVYAAVHPEHGVAYDNPLAALGLGLIGLGLYVQARRAAIRCEV